MPAGEFASVSDVELLRRKCLDGVALQPFSALS